MPESTAVTVAPFVVPDPFIVLASGIMRRFSL